VFIGRRRLFKRELIRAGIDANSEVLDIGTGTHLRLHNLHVGRVTGLDSNNLAIEYCVSKGLGKVQCGDICALPYADRSFDYVLTTE
jgi:ubiquinone/menaquinone biosynthesis C-methylase UbiE